MKKVFRPNAICLANVFLYVSLIASLLVFMAILDQGIKGAEAREYLTLFFLIIKLIIIALAFLSISTLTTKITIDEKGLCYQRIFWKRAMEFKDVKKVTELELRLKLGPPITFMPRLTMNPFQNRSYDLEISKGNRITRKDRDLAFFLFGHYDGGIVYIHDIRSFAGYGEIIRIVQKATKKRIGRNAAEDEG